MDLVKVIFLAAMYFIAMLFLTAGYSVWIGAYMFKKGKRRLNNKTKKLEKK